MDRKDIVNMILASQRQVLLEKDDENDLGADALDESMSLLGKKSILDSLSLVTLIVVIEQKLKEEQDILITIADERAMSQHKSPFRTVGTLADYVCLLAGEERLK